jgi:L-amino acid N-acyltransferase YncA
LTTLRPALPADEAQILEIVSAVITSGDAFLYEHPFSPADLRAWLASHAACFVAADDGRIAGGYVLRPNHPGRGSHVANASYFVSPAARGQGIGRLLGEHSLAEARRLGFRAMQFNAVVSTNRAAVALWTSLGFRIIGTSPGAFRLPDGHIVDLHIMHRSLD